MKVDHLSVSLEPFVEQGITVSNVMLDVRGVEYTSDDLDVRKLSLQVDTNVTDIILNASLKDGHVNVKELTIKDVDALALQTLFMPDSNESNESDESDTLVATEMNASNDAPGPSTYP